MVDLGSYLLAVLALALSAGSLLFAAHRLRRRLLAAWRGPEALLVELVTAVGLVVWISELLGLVGLFERWPLVAASVLVAAATLLLSPPAAAPPPAATRRAGWGPMTLVALGVVALVAFHWAITTKGALDRGIFNFDSLWYHMPFSAEMVQTGSVTGMWHTETVFTNWFYPQNSELLHAVGIALTERDTLSLFLNFGWLAIAFLAAWVIGRPYGRGELCVVATAIALECHTLVVREPGAAKNDIVAAALLLAAVAILVAAHAARSRGPGTIAPGWALAAAGLAVGLAAGTKVTVLAMAAALSVAVLVLAPAGRRWAAAGWWFVPALAGGGFWYLRNLVVAGNPLPAIESIGPISLPHPERLQLGRPDFSVAHYATDTGVWRDYFFPGLEDAFGVLWPVVIGAAVLGAAWALLGGRDRIVRAAGAVALFGMAAYLFTPLSAAGAEGEPVGFAINVRFLVPALLLALALVPLPRAFDPPGRRWALLAALVVVFLITDRPDQPLRDASRPFAAALVLLAVVAPAALLYARSRGAARGLVIAGFAGLALLVAVLGYPTQRHYLDSRFANAGPEREWIPGMDLDAAYRWARGVGDSRIGLAGTSAGFAGYGFYGTDLSNRVVYLGADAPNGGFDAIQSCAAFRQAVDDADLDYLVTSPFLNFLHPSDPVPSPEGRWLRGSDAVEPVLREGQVTVWRVTGELDPAACGPGNAPLEALPQTPAS